MDGKSTNQEERLLLGGLFCTLQNLPDRTDSTWHSKKEKNHSKLLQLYHNYGNIMVI